jgi:hypothetical protein
MIALAYAGSRYETQKEPPPGISDTIELWLRAAHLDGHFSYRAIDRTKGTGTMTRVHAISVRDGRFVNARVRPDGRGNANSWIVSIPIPAEFESGQFLARLQHAERTVNGDEDQILASKLAMLHTYLEGKPIDTATINPLMAARSKFETVEYMEHDLETLSARRLFVRKTGPGTYDWRKRFAKVPVPPLQEEWAPTLAETFILSLTADERILIMELMHLHARMEDTDGNMQLRLPNGLPMFEEEIVQFMDKAEPFGLVKQIGDNPHGILGKVWRLDFPRLLVCIMQIGLLFPQDARQQSLENLAETGLSPENTPNLEDGLMAVATEIEDREAPVTDEPHQVTLNIIRTITLHAPDETEEELASLQEELAQAKRLLGESDAARETNDQVLILLRDRVANGAVEIERLRAAQEALSNELSDKERQARENEELSIRLTAQIRSLEEWIANTQNARAEAEIDRILLAVSKAVDQSDVPREVLLEAMKRRLPKNFLS